MDEKVHQWIAGRWAVDRDDELDNTKVNKYSAYHHLGTNPLFQNQLVWKLCKLHFQDDVESDQHAGFSGVKTHENGVFLYKSTQAEYAVVSRFMDYFWLGCLGGFATGASNFLFLPLFVASVQLPRKWAAMRHFTYHAELLPHTEQVVFHKVTLFGAPVRHYVDIRNLERVDAEMVGSPLLWDINTFDSQMIFRDTTTTEFFVFDSSGVWN